MWPLHIERDVLLSLFERIVHERFRRRKGVGFANSHAFPVLRQFCTASGKNVDIFFWTFILEELKVDVLRICGIGAEELGGGGLFCTAFSGIILNGAKLQLDVC